MNYERKPSYEEVKKEDGIIEQVYVDGKLSTTFTGLTAYKRFASSLYCKKVLNGTWVKRIKDSTNYDGSRSCTITYDNDTVSVFTFEY